jgi:hypothetical protein
MWDVEMLGRPVVMRVEIDMSWPWLVHMESERAVHMRHSAITMMLVDVVRGTHVRVLPRAPDCGFRHGVAQHDRHAPTARLQHRPAGEAALAVGPPSSAVVIVPDASRLVDEATLDASILT